MENIKEIVKEQIELKELIKQKTTEIKDKEDKIKNYMFENNLTVMDLEHLAKVTYSEYNSKRLDSKKVKDFLGDDLINFQIEITNQRLTVTKCK